MANPMTNDAELKTNCNKLSVTKESREQSLKNKIASISKELDLVSKELDLVSKKNTS